MIDRLLKERHSLKKRIIVLFISLVLVLFLTIFIFAYINTKNEYEKKLFYKMEILAILVESEIKQINTPYFSKHYKIGDTLLKLTLKQAPPTKATDTLIQAKRYQLIRTAHGNHQYQLQIDAFRSDVYTEVLHLTLNHILLPYLLVTPLFILLLFFLLLKNLKPLTLIEREISVREATNFQALTTEHLPKELYSLVLALNQMFERMQNYQNQQHQFIANAAHEMRSPITALNLQLQILKSHLSTSSEAQQSFNSMEAGLLRIQNLVTQMMSLVHQESIISEHAYLRINLSEILKQCIEQLYPSIENKDINLSIERLEDIHVRAHPAQVNSIIINLLDNAIKYTPQQGSINISLYANNTKAILSIEDSGSGINSDEIANVFQRFYRSPSTQQIIGSGLGLAIVKTAIDQLNGRIYLKQSELGGLLVIVELNAYLS